jgi:hypothetical protein
MSPEQDDDNPLEVFIFCRTYSHKTIEAREDRSNIAQKQPIQWWRMHGWSSEDSTTCHLIIAIGCKFLNFEEELGHFEHHPLYSKEQAYL